MPTAGNLKNVNDNIDVTTPKVNDSVVVDIIVAVDGKDATVDMDTANNNLNTEFSDDGFTVVRSEGIYF